MTDNDVKRIEPPDIMRPNTALMRGLIAAAVALVALAAFALYLQYRSIAFDPTAWRTASSAERARMLRSLLEQTDFIGFSREEVVFYLGPAEFDERLFWYDLGVIETEHTVDPRGDVGDPDHLYGVFRYDIRGAILDVLYSHRRPVLGSEEFDSTAWADGTPAERRAMFTRALGRIRGRGLQKTVVTSLLGPPDGTRIRAEYDVGTRIPYGSNRALILEFGPDDIVDTSFIEH
ncbi:MAG: hypothetical protein Kow0074_25630 [Candidatus Zixiibacteriota bacterium]